MKTDNQAAEKLAAEGGSWRTRHFCVKAAGIRQQVALGLVSLEHVPGTAQLADGFTKALGLVLIDQFRKQLGLTDGPSEPAAAPEHGHTTINE